MKRVFKLGCFGLLVLVLIAFVAAVLMVRSVKGDADQKRDELVAAARTALPKYLALGARLDADPFFSARRPEGDAGPWLNPRINWGGPPKSGTPAELALPEPVKKKLNGWGDKWVEHGDDADVAALNPAWMARLDAWGHWNLLAAGGPLADLAAIDLLAMPFPSFMDLLGWTKVRLLQALSRQDFAAASREVRQLAYLSHSTESMLGAMVAIAMLKQEREAYDHAVKAKLEVGEWKAYEASWLDDAKNFARASMTYAAPLMPEDVYRQAASVRAMRCAALNEASMLVVLRKRFNVSVPAVVDAAYASPPAPCRLTVAKKFIASPQPENFDAAFGAGEGSGPALVLNLYPSLAFDLLESEAMPSQGVSALAGVPPPGAAPIQ